MSHQEQPTFDADGYPTDETLEIIKKWPMKSGLHANALLDFVAAAWHWPDFGVSHELKPAEAEVVHAEPGDRYLRLATGGWSGNESLIAALDHSMGAFGTWRLSSAGGLHIYRYWPENKRRWPTQDQGWVRPQPRRGDRW